MKCPKCGVLMFSEMDLERHSCDLDDYKDKVAKENKEREEGYQFLNNNLE